MQTWIELHVLTVLNRVVIFPTTRTFHIESRAVLVEIEIVFQKTVFLLGNKERKLEEYLKRRNQQNPELLYFVSYIVVLKDS